MWLAKTKDELIIEVWEKLDCENVGAAEIEAIEIAVADRFGAAAVGSPMVVARMLADEGAELRHSEIMRLFVERNTDRPYEAEFRNILRFSSFRAALGTIRDLNNLRRKFTAENDKEGLRLVRETALRGKRELLESAEKRRSGEDARIVYVEMSQWLSIWLQTPEFFADWVELRQRSVEFVKRFGSEDLSSE
ncbi:MAG: hypothetical protein ABJA02_13705 [Acidobacteriota bacterium]